MLRVQKHHNFPISFGNSLWDRKSEPQTECDEHQFSEHQSRIVERSPDLKCKLKTSLCKNFTRNGYCPYGSKCQFAHGPSELRCNLSSNTSYKTKYCFSFLKKGSCSFGNRCNFLHEEPSRDIEGYAPKKISRDIRNICGGLRKVIREARPQFTSRLLHLLQRQQQY